MRRLVLVLLIVLMPLQAVWAAAANACGHEPTIGKTHFGHHEHAQTAAVQASDHAVSDDVADADWSCGADCSTCHGHGWSAALLHSPLAVTQSGPDFLFSGYQRFVPQRDPESPLRPPLASLA